MPFPDPEHYKLFTIDLHHKVKSREWWIYNFPGQEGLETRDYAFDAFLRFLDPKDYDRVDMKVCQENSRAFMLYILFLRKSAVSREIIAGNLIMAFPVEVENILGILKASPSQDIVTIGGSPGEIREIMRTWSYYYDLDPENPPLFPIHLQ